MIEIRFGLSIFDGSLMICKEFLFPLWMEGNKTKLLKGDVSSILKLYDAQQYTRKLDIIKQYTWIIEGYPVQILLKFYVEKEGEREEVLSRAINFNFSEVTTDMEDIKNMALLNFPYEFVQNLIWKYKKEPIQVEELGQEQQGEKGLYILLPQEEYRRFKEYINVTGLTQKQVIIELIKTLDLEKKLPLQPQP